jgi:hypothetical protein
MNPFLEQNDTWEDFHQSYITHARDLLTGQVGPNYLVKIEVRIYLHELSAEERRYFGRADVGVTTPPATTASSPPAAACLVAPVRLTLPAVDVERHASIQITDRRQRRVVTVLELLSPSDKARDADRNDYLAKRTQVLARHVHLVEIDLCRGGERPRPPDLPPCDYYALVSRFQDRPELDMWPIRLRDRLPTIPVPLTTPDPDVPLDLQALLNRVYDAADYGKYIYSETPEPPLSAEDAAWAQQLLKESA